MTEYLNELSDYARRQVEELLPVIKKYNDYSEEQIEELRTHLMAMFLEGAGWQKKQMLKDAVKGMICATITGTNAISFLSPLPKELTAGDMARVIVIKE